MIHIKTAGGFALLGPEGREIFVYDNQVVWFAFKLGCSDSFVLLNHFKKRLYNCSCLKSQADKEKGKKKVKVWQVKVKSIKRHDSVFALTAVNQSCLSVVYPDTLWLLMLCLKAIFHVPAWSNKPGLPFITRGCWDLQGKNIPLSFCILGCVNWLNNNLQFVLVLLKMLQYV